MTTKPVIEIRFLGGNCPVQAEGTINGEAFYFRARGAHWSMSIGGADPVGEPSWYYEERYGDGPFDAGWMPDDEALTFIGRAARHYIADDSAAELEVLRVAVSQAPPMLDPRGPTLSDYARTAYRNDDFPERQCDHCGTMYCGPAVYCSLDCAIADSGA